MNKVKTTLCMCMIICMSFFFAGCFTFVQGENGEPGSLEDSLQTLVYTSKGDGSETGNDAYGMVSELTNRILKGLYDEYGNPLTAISRSIEDTHLNAIYQDSWLWGGSWLYGEDGNKLYTYLDFANSEVVAYMNYQLYQVLLGKDVLPYTPNDFASNSEYIALKNAGEFNEENLLNLAKQLSHTGFFYYEIDNIAEFLLESVIGESAVTKDLKKFVDVNNNATFDYVEDYIELSISKYKNIIVSYDNSNERKDTVIRNEIWSRIVWGDAESVPSVPSDISNVTNEKAKDINELKVPEFAYGEDIVNNPKYSGFKNYTNTIYFICYSSMLDFSFVSKDNDGNIVTKDIPNVLEMSHVPNITKDVYKPEDTEYIEEIDGFKVPIKQYKSVLVSVKKLTLFNSFYFNFYTNQDFDITIDIKIRYHFTDDSYREYIGTYAGIEKTVEAKVGQVTFNNEEILQYGTSISITDELVQEYKEMGLDCFKEEDVTDMARLGVTNILVNTYLPFHYPEGVTPPWWQIDEGYIAAPSDNFVGSTFNFNNEIADFFEFKFELVGEYSEPVNFGICFSWM